jgi:hypothetical protein
MPRPVVFVPGLPASELFRVTAAGRERVFLKLPPDVPRLLGPDDLAAGDGVEAGAPLPKIKIGFLDLAKFADSLYAELRDLGATHVEKVGWDWRRPVWDDHPGQVQERIGQAIDRAFAAGGPVLLVCHSTGGLAARWFLENSPASVRPKIGAVAAFGVPWVGTLDSFEPLIGEKGFPFTSKEDVQRMMGHSWAAFDLLPPDPAATVDALYDRARLVVGPHTEPSGELAVSSPIAERGWIDRQAPTVALRAAMDRRRIESHARLGARSPTLLGVGAQVPVVLFAGWGRDTLRQATLSPNGEVTISSTLDGQDPGMDDGDGTIPRVSAAWLRGGNVRRFHVPIGHYPNAGELPHARLWNNPGAAAALAALLHDDPLPSQAEAAMDWSDFVETSNDLVTVRCQASDANGMIPAGARIRLRLGPQITPWDEVDPAFGGRYMVRVARDAVPTFGNRFRRLEVEIDLANGGSPKRVALLCRK